ncbi:MAG TPA: MFS transporter [Rhizomicrobium sp.]|nr:MFS transporter [Rhizomicrobium sp.]
MSKTIDIKAFIDGRPIAPFLWALVAMCFLIVVADGMDVAIMGFVTPPILQDWNISRPAFGLVISAAPLGLVIGALIAGPSSDRFGRKIVLTASVLLFGIFTTIAAGASSPQEMALLRLLAGMGMGAAMPNATTLLSEYVPLRRRSLLITIMFSGFTLGSAVIGFIAGIMIPHFGWRSVLLVGGITPLVLVPFLVALLPESARYMALQGTPADKIAAMLGRVTGYQFTGGESFVSSEPSLRTKRPIGVLFSDGYAATTIALWITYFMGLMVVYLLTGWLPTLMRDAGLTITAAANVTAMFQVGATIGAILIGWSMDLRHPSRVIGAAYLAGAIFIMALAWVGALSGRLAVLVFAAGFCVSGAQTSLNAFAPGRYPTVARATGVSWMLGMGRFGGIVGSLVGGALLGLGWGFGAILGILAVPALCAAIAIASVSDDAKRVSGSSGPAKGANAASLGERQRP